MYVAQASRLTQKLHNPVDGSLPRNDQPTHVQVYRPQPRLPPDPLLGSPLAGLRPWIWWVRLKALPCPCNMGNMVVWRSLLTASESIVAHQKRAAAARLFRYLQGFNTKRGTPPIKYHVKRGTLHAKSELGCISFKSPLTTSTLSGPGFFGKGFINAIQQLK